LHRISKVKTGFTIKLAVGLGLLLGTPVVHAQTLVQSTFAVPAQGVAYADIADLVTISPLILDAQIRKVTSLPDTQAVGVPANIQRVLVDADVTSLIRGTDGFRCKSALPARCPKDATKARYRNCRSAATSCWAARWQWFAPGTIKLSKPDALGRMEPGE
jgi:hypothetical protein